MFKSGLLDKELAVPTQMQCLRCCQGKSKVLPFSSSPHMSKSPFELVHSDVWGMAPIVASSGYRYFVTFIDDYSRFTWVYFLRAKSEVFSIFKTFVSMIETHFDVPIKILRSDSGESTCPMNFENFFKQKEYLPKDLVLIPHNKMG